MKIALPIFKNRTQGLIFILTIALLLLSLAYLSKGFYNLVFEPGRLGARDLFDRWKEQQYIYLKIYPYDLNPNLVNPKLGRVWSGGYLPWSFFTGFFFFPNISWTLTRYYHLFLNLISLFVLVRFAYQVGIPFGKLNAYFFVVACLAISSHCTTLNVGQYGIIINALLIGVFWLLEKHKNSWTGLLMGIALVKPNISATYFFILLLKKRITAALITCLYLVFATVTITLLTKISLSEIFKRFLEQLYTFSARGMTSISILIKLNFNPILISMILAGVGAGLVFLLFYFWRKSSLLTLFAIASVIGRVFTYHLFYDNLMLVFLLLALLKLTFSHPHKLNILMLSLVGLSLWISGSMTKLPYFELWQMSI